MPLSITDSPDITQLDMKVLASLCDEQFHIDLSPSVFISGREAFPEGASVKIVNPVGVTIKDYLTSGYDIEAPFTYGFDYTIPLVAGNFQYGTYKIYVRLTDSDGTQYETAAKPVKLCAPDKKNKTKKYGCLNVKIDGNCVDGKVIFMLDAPPNYQGNIFTDQVIDIEVSYPTESGLPPLPSEHPTFSVQMYEGEYKVTGTVCATYNDGDNVYFEILYKVKCSKIIKCVLNECCVYEQLEVLNGRLKTDCSQADKDETASKILDTLRLLKTIKLAAQCGKDPSEYITELEELLGCSCSCNCNDGTPIINQAPAGDFSFEGCGFEETTVGLTKVITFTTKDYTLTEGDDWLAVSDAVDGEGGCTKSQSISFNEDKLAGVVNNLISEAEEEPFNICAETKEDILQANTLDVETYKILGTVGGPATCDWAEITAPTGFAVTGNTRVSAFGKMEWYATLAAANTAAGVGETVLIFNDTAENLTPKNGVNYMGIGVHSLGNIALSAVGGVIRMANLTVGDITTDTDTSVKLYLNNTVVTGTANFGGTMNVEGGYFTNNTKIINVTGSAVVSNIYTNGQIAIAQNGWVSHATVRDTSAGGATAAVFLNISDVESGYRAGFTHSSVHSLNNVGVYSLAYSDDSIVETSHLSIKTFATTGLVLHGGSMKDSGGTVSHHNNVTNIGPAAAVTVYRTSALAPTATDNTTNYNVTHVNGYSQTGVGIHSVLGSMSYCKGFSIDNRGIIISSSENVGFNLEVVECIGESRNNNGIFADRDIFIYGGTYISRLDTAFGNPIVLGASLLFPNQYFNIIGVKTIAKNTTAKAIRADAAVTAKIANCVFTNPYDSGTVEGIDHVGVGGLITLQAVIVDAYNNIT